MVFDFLKKKKEIFFWVLDIGSEAVKTLIIKKEEGRIIVLGVGVQYFDGYGFFGGQDPAEIIFKKAILKSMEEALQRFSVASKSKAENYWKKWPVLLSLPPDMLKARVSNYSFERQNPKEKISKSEKEIIRKKCLETVKAEISGKFSEETGILAKDIRWIVFKISEEKIDGYSVADFVGLDGRELTAKVLVVFLGESYFKNAERILSGIGLNISKIIHISENLFSLPIAEKSDSALFNVGGDATQFFMIKNGSLEISNEIKVGGRIFSQKLSDILGISEESARILKEKYSNGGLSSRSKERIKEIFNAEKEHWKKRLDLGFKEIGCESLFSADIFIFGGASEMPEIKEILSGASSQPFYEPRIIYPKDLNGLDDRTKILNSPQYTPSLLIADSIFKN